MLGPWFPHGVFMRFSLLLSAALIVTASSLVQADTSHSVDLSSMDKSVKPGDDFYAYANGDWLKRTTIPPDQASWGSFNILFQETQKRTRALIENAGKGASAGSEQAKIGDFYSSFMDEKGIEAKGVTPIQAQLTAIAAI